MNQGCYIYNYDWGLTNRNELLKAASSLNSSPELGWQTTRGASMEELSNQLESSSHQSACSSQIILGYFYCFGQMCLGTVTFDNSQSNIYLEEPGAAILVIFI